MSKVTFKKVVDIFNKIEGISSRNEMTELLADFYKSLSKEEAQIVTYLVQGRIAPLFVESEFNYSEKSIINVLKGWNDAEKLGLDIEDIRSDTGDIGDTVEIFIEELGNGKGRKTLLEIYEILWKLVYTTGTGSVERKNDLVVSVLKEMTSLEAKYFARIICGSLRLGVNAKTLLDVFSFMRVGDKSLKDDLEKAYGVCSDPGLLLNDGWESIAVTPGMPVLSRLVERVADFQEVFDRLGDEVLVQPKFDGLRCQIHKIEKSSLRNDSANSIWMQYLEKEESLDLFGGGGDVEDEIRLFTRNLEDVTEMFPEIVDAARDIKAKSFILDSEVLGWDYKEETFLTYQNTMRRRRVHDVGKTSDAIPVKALTFDILYHDGEDLLEKDTQDRIKLLEKLIADTEGGIALSETEIVSDVAALDEFFSKKVSQGYEGLIVKQKEGGYLPGKRNYEWIKLKKSMKKGMVDTVDLVVVGYQKGSGRRGEFGIGSLLGAIYNEEKDVFETVCKVGTGLSDELLQEVHDKLEAIEVKEVPKNVAYDKSIEADVWVSPKYVITVEADEVSRNISKTNGVVAGGLSLRFPRLIEFDRDKNPEDITNLKELMNIFEKQKNIAKKA